MNGLVGNLIFDDVSKMCRENSSPIKNLTRIKDTLHEDLITFMIISHSVLLRMRNGSEKICRENQNTHFEFSNSPHPHPPKIQAFMR
jgi:hypothetical protein